MLPLPQCPEQKTEEQTGCCLKAQWLSTCKTLCCPGMVTRFVWAKSSSPLHIPLSKKGLPDKPCILSTLLLVDTMARDWSGDTGVFFPLPQPTHRHCSPCSLWLLQQTVCCCGKSSHHPAFSQSCFSQPSLPSSLGSH